MESPQLRELGSHSGCTHAGTAAAVILTRSVREATQPESSLTLRASMYRGRPECKPLSRRPLEQASRPGSPRVLRAGGFFQKPPLRLSLEVELRPQTEEERGSGLELSGVNRLDVGRHGEPTGDRGGLVEIEALLVARRRDGTERLPEDIAGRQVVVAHTP